jgi:hypothetical protein
VNKAGEVEVQFQHSCLRYYMEMGGKFQAPDALIHGRRIQEAVEMSPRCGEGRNLPCKESNLSRPAHIQSLYRMSYLYLVTLHKLMESYIYFH